MAFWFGGLLLWPSGLVAFWLKVAFWFGDLLVEGGLVIEGSLLIEGGLLVESGLLFWPSGVIFWYDLLVGPSGTGVSPNSSPPPTYGQ